MKRNAAAIILAGGKSSRMGTNKALLKVEGKSLIEFIADQLKDFFHKIYISTNSPELYSFTGFSTINDEVPGEGPLIGILSCLKASEYECNFITACDIPRFDMDFVMNMVDNASGTDAVVPVNSAMKFEPMLAVYTKNAIPALTELVDKGERGVRRSLDHLNIKTMPLPENNWYQNLNSERDFADFLKTCNTKF